MKQKNAVSPQPAEQNLLHIENMSKGFVWLALLADGAWKVLCKGQRRGIANTEKSLALVLSRFKTKLSVALIFVITRSALHFKKKTS